MSLQEGFSVTASASLCRPVGRLQRVELLDSLRGFALVGICAANLTSFAGRYVMSDDVVSGVDWGGRATLFLIDWLVEGKFYALFAMLFGVGFHLQSTKTEQADDIFTRFWLRRMAVLLAIGLFHMWLVWYGDILTLYACLGMAALLFRRVSSHALLYWIGGLLLVPLGIHVIATVTSEAWFWTSLSGVAAQWKASMGFSNRTALSLRLSHEWGEVLADNLLGAVTRPMSYLKAGRPFQVLGQFLLGVWIGRALAGGFHAPRPSLVAVCQWSIGMGLVLNLIYAGLKAMMGAAFVLGTTGFLQAVVYHGGSTLLAVGYASLIALGSQQRASTWTWFAPMGRMALSNYLMQSFVGLLLFYGYGLGWSGRFPFFGILPLALAIVAVQRWLSATWLTTHEHGPLEGVWRRISYGSEWRSMPVAP